MIAKIAGGRDRHVSVPKGSKQMFAGLNRRR